MSLFLVLTVLISAAAQLDPESVAGRVQLVYEGSQSLRCEFHQLYTSGTTGKVTEASGELYLKKPGKMRWDYRSPEKKLYVSDGETVYWYIPADRQVTRMNLAQADQEQSQILFLMGRGNLLRDFEISAEERFNPLYENSYLLKLVPKGEEGFDYLVLEINPSDFFVERMIVVDAFGNSTDYRFVNIRPAEIQDDIFSFVIPRGVEVFDQ